MSDLQCPATFLLVGLAPVPRVAEGVESLRRGAPGLPPAVPGPPWLTELADELRDHRIALVCSGGDITALAAAKGLAGRLGVPHRGIDGLEPLPAGPAGAEPRGADARGADARGADPRGPVAPGADAPCADARAARHRAALDDLADLHRGETVLVVTDACVLTTLWPDGRSADGEEALSPYRLVTVQVDGDGWRLLGRSDARRSDNG
jgi:2,3-bisphosphoglycerate-dependent phosphoglycerate mutase